MIRLQFNPATRMHERVWWCETCHLYQGVAYHRSTPRTCDACKRENEAAYRARRAAASIKPAVRAAVVARDGYVCRYCGCAVRHRKHLRDIERDTIELDHVVPVFEGGKSTVDNLVVCCMWCNRKKAGRPLPTLVAS